MNDFIHWVRWLWIVRTPIYLFRRIRYFVKYGKDEYGKPGFTQLMYRGIPIIQRPDVPKDTIYFWRDDDDLFTMKKILKKDGSLDMRYNVNKLWEENEVSSMLKKQS